MDSNRSIYFLESGFIYFTRAPAMVGTVLGSCVAVCLWDKRRGYGGMSHFQRPWTQDPSRSTSRFGNVSTAKLVSMMRTAGSRTGDIEAQIIGGAGAGTCLQDGVSKKNIRIARKVLERRGVQVVSEDVGGRIGRRVVFDTGSGEVMVHKVRRAARS